MTSKLYSDTVFNPWVPRPAWEVEADEQNEKRTSTGSRHFLIAPYVYF